MITYMFFYIFMNLRTFSCIVLFGLCTRTNNIQDYIGLYMKYPIFACFFIPIYFIHRRFSSTIRFFFPKKTLFILVWITSTPIFLGFNRTLYEHFFSIYCRGFPLRSTISSN
ncbi:hypothetical protein NC651_016123 [Populus alba x Populus x berolinensis]|nr:hypothetical protein NC651_016123 [Populus alba x Populus x berolinensis]